MGLTKQQELVLNQFEPALRKELFQFGNHLTNIEADVLVFMARKAVGLYDILRFLNFTCTEGKHIVSDRILDLDIEFLRDKKVALVDDTLILGTTLFRAKEKLIENQIKVEVHVFCVDDQNWQSELVEPNYIQVSLNPSKVMSFCISEVRSFSIIGRPYLVDFPLSKELWINYEFVNKLNNLKDWSVFELPCQTKEICNNKLFTIYPNEDIQDAFNVFLGFDCTKIINHAKLRLFIVENTRLTCKVLPLLTLKAIDIKTLNELYDLILSSSKAKIESIKTIRKFIKSPISKQRFVQYALSYLFGKFSKGILSLDLPNVEKLAHDSFESELHFGRQLSNSVYDVIQNFQVVKNLTLEFKESEIPGEIVNWCSPIVDDSNSYENPRNNTVLEFFGLFKRLYDIYEKPVREDVKRSVKLGQTKYLDPNQRLNKGIPFSIILEYFSDKYFLRIQKQLAQLLSLSLDISNDYGVSVPITCHEGDVVFRAYRHGELGVRLNNDLFLVFLNSFLSTNQRNHIPHLLLEKLLVLFYRISGNHTPNLLDTNEDVLTIGWDLMGAVMTRGTRDFFPLNREQWLTDNLIFDKIVIFKEGKYFLTDIKQWEFANSDSNSSNRFIAEEYGEMFGNLYRNEKIPILSKSPLEEKSITLLASCTETSDTAMAIIAETQVFLEWYEGRRLYNGDRFINIEVLKNEEMILEELQLLRDKKYKGFHSFHQAYFKYFNAYRNDLVPHIIDDVIAFGESNFLTPSVRKWKQVWNELLPNFQNKKLANKVSLVGKDEEYVKHMNNAIKHLWEVGNWMMLYEILLNQKLIRDFPKVKIDSIVTFEVLETGEVFTKRIIQKSVKSGQVIYDSEIGFRTRFASNLKEKRIGEVIFNPETNSEYKIINIDNRFVKKNSQEKLIRFNNNFISMGFIREPFMDDVDKCFRIINDFEKEFFYQYYFDLIISRIKSVKRPMIYLKDSIKRIYEKYGMFEFEDIYKEFKRVGNDF